MNVYLVQDNYWRVHYLRHYASDKCGKTIIFPEKFSPLVKIKFILILFYYLFLGRRLYVFPVGNTLLLCVISVLFSQRVCFFTDGLGILSVVRQLRYSRSLLRRKWHYRFANILNKVHFVCLPEYFGFYEQLNSIKSLVVLEVAQEAKLDEYSWHLTDEKFVLVPKLESCEIDGVFFEDILSEHRDGALNKYVFYEHPSKPIEHRKITSDDKRSSDEIHLSIIENGSHFITLPSFAIVEILLTSSPNFDKTVISIITPTATQRRFRNKDYSFVCLILKPWLIRNFAERLIFEKV